MSYSKLTDKVMLASPYNYTKGRQGYKICKITPHHMAGMLSAERCAELFQNPNRGASANYCIGSDGTIVCNVEEENRAWTSSNGVNDCQAITFEIANNSGAPNWTISDKAWKATVNLCVDICKRYGFRLNFNGKPSGSLTMHKMFDATDCPGPYLEARMGQLAKEVNEILDGGAAPSQPSKPASSNPRKKTGFVKVTYKGSDGLALHNKPSWDDNTIAKTVKDGTYTIVDGQDVDGVWMYKIKSGLWITSSPEYVKWLASINKQPSKPSEKPKKTVTEIAKEVISGKWGNDPQRSQKLKSAGYNPTTVQDKVNELMWVNAKPKMTATQFAKEVWYEGKHGTGATREANAKRLGVNYAEAKRLINILASGGKI